MFFYFYYLNFHINTLKKALKNIINRFWIIQFELNLIVLPNQPKCKLNNLNLKKKD